MADQTEANATPEFEVNPNELSTNFYYTFGNAEIFNCQFTVRGNPTGAEIDAHIRSTVSAMKQVVELGGHAKPIGQQTPKSNADAPETPKAPAAYTGLPGEPQYVPVAPAVPAAQSAPNYAATDVQCFMIEIGQSFKTKAPQLNFHCTGLQDPLRFTRSIDEMVKLLAPLGYTAAHIVVGQKYPAKAIVTWQQGEKYKNVIAVKPA